MALFRKTFFDETCLAWSHGPVYREVYDVFKNFKYNPIDDTRFAMLQHRFKELSDVEKNVIDTVIESFGVYSGKTLEKITHREKPWMKAHENCFPHGFSNEVISKESMKEYFTEISKQFDLRDVKEINRYIAAQLERNEA